MWALLGYPLPEVPGVQLGSLAIDLLYAHEHIHEEVENQKPSQEALAVYFIQLWSIEKKKKEWVNRSILCVCI